MAAHDTSSEAHEVQLAIWQRLGPAGRYKLVERMSEELRELSRAGIRMRHACYSEEHVELALRRMMWGEALFLKVYPEHADLKP